MKEYHWVVGDRPTITFTVKRDGSAVDLTGYASARFKMKLNTTTVFQASGSCTSLAADGTCSYAVGTSDFNTAGSYYARLLLTTNSKNEHTERFRIVVDAV